MKPSRLDDALQFDVTVRRDLTTMLALFEKYRSQIREEENRNSFFDAEQGVYDIAVEYEHEKHNDVAALNHAEAAHGRSLLDAVNFGAHRADLAPLRAAEREALSVAELYDRSSPLLGSRATKEHIIREMNSAEIIHFAGHYVVDGSTLADRS